MNFTFVSGNLGLDLAGTVPHRRHERLDLLGGPADLALWTVEAGLLDAPPEIGDSGLALGKALREAVYRLAAGPSPDGSPVDLVNRVAAAPPVSVRLRGGVGVERSGDLSAALSTVARDAIELLGGARAVRVKECAGERCTRLFLDLSRASARRWCDMQDCGNRAKAAGFRSRHPT